MTPSPEHARARLVGADHGVLSSFDPDHGLHAVPVCFAVVGDRLAVPVDRVKAKRSTDLRRTHNLALDPRATLLCEHWDPDDWSTLWWVRATLRRCADVDVNADDAVKMGLEGALRDRYAQYRTTVFSSLLVFDIESITGWAANGSV